jgi:nicotinamide mononucleotide (NMN) deamidase PncC
MIASVEIDSPPELSTLVDWCRDRRIVIGAAESLSGGLLGYLLTRTPVKRRLLGIGPGPVVSHRTAVEMAIAARRLLGCDISVSLTGVAGPDEQDGMPVGTVFLGLAASGHPARATRHMLGGTPDHIRMDASRLAIAVVIDHLRVRVLPA